MKIRLFPLFLLLCMLLSGCADTGTEPPLLSESPLQEDSSADSQPPISPTEPPADHSPPDPSPAQEPAAPVPADPTTVSSPAPEPTPDAFVRVADYLPGIFIDLRYATEDNFTGQVIYSFTDAYLRYGTVLKLAAARETLLAQGFDLLIWDAFRPVQAQFRLWEVYPDPTYVANPETGFSSHSRGNTVDVTLVNQDDTPVEMPTGFDDFSSLADRDYSDVPETAAANARLLEQAMSDHGFRPYRGEWWHFSDTDEYPVDETFIPDTESEDTLHADHGY